MRGAAEGPLLTRLRQVWPEPVRLSLRRLGSGPGTTYLVLPSVRHPVLLVPADDPGAATAIRRFDEGQRAGFLQRALAARAQQHGLLRFAPLHRVVVDGPDVGLVPMVREAVPDAATVVVRLGRPRHGRALVLQALAADGRSLAFAKCAFGRRIEDLRREHASLTELGTEPAPGLRAPRVMGFHDAADRAVLILEALAPDRPATEDGIPVDVMRSFAATGDGGLVRLRDTMAVVRLDEGIEALADDTARRWLRRSLDELLDELGGVPVRTGAWHGDWVGWNMARDGDRVLLWDWEHHETGVPMGLDHVHHLAQQLRMRAGTHPGVEDRWLAMAQQALAEDWDVHGSAAEATLRLYLLMVNLRYVEDRSGDPSGQPRVGWSRSLLERIGERQMLGQVS